MSMDISLKIAVSGLQATQQGLEVVSRNVSNVNTPGYTKKILPQETHLHEEFNFGVATGTIYRNMDLSLQRELLRQESQVANLEVTERYLEQVEVLHGNPDGETAIAHLLNRLRDGFLRLRDTPEAIPLQNQVVNYAQDLALTFNRLSEGLNYIRALVQEDIEDSVAELNAQLASMQEYNENIRALAYEGKSTADLEDKRDETMRKISQLVDVTYVRRGDHTIGVVGYQGYPLLESSVETFSIATTTIQPTSAYDAANPLTSTIPPIYASDGTTDMTNQLRGGKLEALITLRDQTLPRFQAQLDELAQKLASTLEGQGLRLFENAAAAVPAGTPDTYVGFAGQIRVNPNIVSDPTLLRDGAPATHPNAGAEGFTELLDDVVTNGFQAAITFGTTGLGTLANLDSALPGTATLGDYAREMVAYQANARADASTRLETAETVRDGYQARLSDATGVNIDEEIANLIQLQRSYASIAQIISTNRAMFDSLLGAIR